MSSITQTNKNLNSNFIFKSLSDVITNFKSTSKVLARNAVVNLFKLLDDKFFEEKLWQDDFVNKGFVERTLITSIGEIHFKRRYYVSKNKELFANFFYIDRLFKITFMVKTL